MRLGGRDQIPSPSEASLPSDMLFPLYTFHFSLSLLAASLNLDMPLPYLALTHRILCHSPCISTCARPWVRFQMPKQH